MRILLTGGGTAGHVMPNLAIAAELKKDDAKILYIGSRNKMDGELARRANIKFKGVFTGKFRRYFSLQNFIDVFKIPIGFVQAVYHVGKFNPDVIFSKGGYVAVPVIFAGWVLRKKIIIHEADASPGLTTRISSLFADKILTNFEDTKKYFKKKKQAKITNVGLPIRTELLHGSESKGRKITDFKKNKKTILVMGGSLGAAKINNTLWSSLTQLIPKHQIIHICGKGKSGKVFSNFLLENLKEHYKEFEYIGEKLKDIYAITDIVISRAGANSLKEIEALGVPAVIVPLPGKFSRGDQIDNAKHFLKLDKRRYKLIRNEKLTSKTLTAAIEEIGKLPKRPTNKKDFEKPIKEIVKIIENESRD